MRRLGLRWVITLGCLATFLLFWADSARAEELAYAQTSTDVTWSTGAVDETTAVTVVALPTTEIPAGTATLFFTAPQLTRGSSSVAQLALYDGGSFVARLYRGTNNTTYGVSIAHRLALGSTANHTYSIGAYGSGGTGASISCNTGASPAFAPCQLWIESTNPVSGGASELSDLSDVDTAGAIDGAVLKYDESATEWQVATDDVGSGSSGPITLSAGDRSRLDLMWWGIWAIIGLLFVLMIAPVFLRVFDVRHGLGGRFERG